MASGRASSQRTLLRVRGQALLLARAQAADRSTMV